MKNTFLFLTILAALAQLSCNDKNHHANNKDYTQWVDPHIGSALHGHVFVGASVPFGAVQLGPNNPTQGWDWCSGYNYSDSLLIGFAHTQLSGTGIGDLGDILFMPFSGEVPDSSDRDGYWWVAKYNHDQETVQAGYYAIQIDKYDIKAEVTASERVGFHRYDYAGEGNSRMIIDIKYGTGWDRLTNSSIEKSGNRSISGLRHSKGWAADQRLWFHTEFSKDIIDIKIEKDPEKGILRAILEFDGNGELLVRNAISPVNAEGAENNLLAEMDHWDFDRVHKEAKDNWNRELGKIKVESSCEKDLRTFYTAMFHSMIAPSLFNDANGDYRGADRKIHKDPGHDTYTIFSLWDTYRAAHPLFTITQPERTTDFIKSMMAIYEEQGKLPIWHLAGNETNTMVGYHSVPVIADAYLKGIRGFDAEKAFDMMKASALLDEEGQDHVKNLGWIPAESQHESVAKGLEYAIDDWCIAAMAKEMGKEEVYELFSKRAEYYKYYFDSDIKFMRGKMGDGSWRTPFDVFHSKHNQDDFCEGNSWQYTWLVPHDVEGLIELLGGKEAFVSKLDSLFIQPSDLAEGASPDISGLIGQYAHGNEPGHHIIYLYALAGEQWKTAEKAREVCTTMYSDKPDGLCGNEDCGQMSAWYIFSSMGFYPVNPAGGTYTFGSPLFDQVELSMANGKSFKLIAKNNSRENKYIQSIKLNGKTYTKSYITHSQLLEGGELQLVMGKEPKDTTL